MPNSRIYSFGGGSSGGGAGALGLPIGAVIPFAGPQVQIPDAGVLLCNGALVDRVDFPELFDVIGTLWGTDSATDFRLPTTQGLLLRGVNYGGPYDPEAATRIAIQTGGITGDEVGSYQPFRTQAHTHNSYIAAMGFTLGNSFLGTYNSRTNVNGEINPTYGNSAGGVANKVCCSPASGAIGGNIDVGPLFFNGNFNTNDPSPNSADEVLTRHNQLRSSSFGEGQTVGPNVGMNFLIVYE
jgi:microcystin-dependent protein